MKQSFTIRAESRAVQGKGASRRLRHEGKVPAIIYGGKGDAQSIQVVENDLNKNLKHEAFYTAIIDVELGGVTEQAVLKDLHRHPVRNNILHMDLQRVLADVPLRMHVPIHFKGGDVAPGVKTGGGMLEHQQNQVDVECLPKDLPPYIEVDLSAMNVGETLHLSQLVLSEGVIAYQLKHGRDLPVATIHAPRKSAEDDAAAEAAAKPAAKGGKKK